MYNMLLVVRSFCALTRDAVLTDDSGQKLNDGRLLERYEWRSTDVQKRAWYNS
jgi:hypothetical protein